VGQRKGGVTGVCGGMGWASSCRVRNEVCVVGSTQPTWREWREVGGLMGAEEGGTGLLASVVARDGAGSRRVRNEMCVVGSTQPTWCEWREVGG